MHLPNPSTQTKYMPVCSRYGTQFDSQEYVMTGIDYYKLQITFVLEKIKEYIDDQL